MDQQQKQREATQAITRESLNAYTYSMNNLFAYYQGDPERARKNAWDGEKRAK